MEGLESTDRSRLVQRYGKTFPLNTNIYVDNEVADHCYLLQEGRVRLMMRGRQIVRSVAVLKPGDLFGEEALIIGSTRRNTAVSLSNVTVLALSRDVLLDLMAANKSAAARIVGQLVRRLQLAEEQVQSVALHDTASRVVHALLRMAATVDASAEGLGIDISPLELASRAALDVDSVKNAVRQLREGGYVRIVGEQLIIPDLQPLRQLYQLLGVKEEVRGTRITPKP